MNRSHTFTAGDLSHLSPQQPATLFPRSLCVAAEKKKKKAPSARSTGITDLRHQRVIPDDPDCTHVRTGGPRVDAARIDSAEEAEISSTARLVSRAPRRQSIKVSTAVSSLPFSPPLSRFLCAPICASLPRRSLPAPGTGVNSGSKRRCRGRLSRARNLPSRSEDRP